MRRRLALGLEIVDAALGVRVARPVSVAFDGVPLPRSRGSYSAFGLEITDTLPRVDRHNSCLHALVYRKGLYVAGKTVDLRFSCPARRHVPRRLSFTLVDPSLPEPPTPDPDQATLDAMRAARWRKVALFPGAAYDAGSAPTGLRGRVRRLVEEHPVPVRWARVEARLRRRDGAPGLVIGRAHGDDRGEFLLILGAIPGSMLTSLTVNVEVTVFGRTPDPMVTDLARKHDPLWDLPIESASPPPADDVLLGLKIPGDYTLTSARVVPFKLGKILSSEVNPFNL
jgi:hypothetical protein